MQVRKRTIGALHYGLDKLLLVVGVVLVILSVVLFAGSTSLFADATSYQPKPFTELYFTSPHSLPKTIHADTVYQVPFAIVNRTSVPQTYRYVITVQAQSAIAVQPAVSVTLLPGQSRRQNAVIKAPVPDQPLLTSITLKDMNQSIRFYARP